MTDNLESEAKLALEQVGFDANQLAASNPEWLGEFGYSTYSSSWRTTIPPYFKSARTILNTDDRIFNKRVQNAVVSAGHELLKNALYELRK